MTILISDFIASAWSDIEDWSDRTFGHPVARGPIGPLKHLQKEAGEAITNPGDHSEYADCLILTLDAARRAGLTLEDLMVATIHKMEANRSRLYPPSFLSDEPIEHVRTRPRIVTLCGSTKFLPAFRQAEEDEELAGRIVFSVGCFPHFNGSAPETLLGPEKKALADAIHLRKIELSDEILVLNVGGYIGSSTRAEISHATMMSKGVRYLEPLTA
jgi:hypothetical protein